MTTDRKMIRFDPAKKLPGKTVAESMGIEVSEKAPGGQKVLIKPSGGWAGKKQYSDDLYEGVMDVDGN